MAVTNIVKSFASFCYANIKEKQYIEITGIYVETYICKTKILFSLRVLEEIK